MREPVFVSCLSACPLCSAVRMNLGGLAAKEIVGVERIDGIRVYLVNCKDCEAAWLKHEQELCEAAAKGDSDV